ANFRPGRQLLDRRPAGRPGVTPLLPQVKVNVMADAGPIDRHPPAGRPATSFPGQARGKAFLRLRLQNERPLYAYIPTLPPHRAATQSAAAAVGRSLDAVYKALAKLRQALFDCVTRSLAQGGAA